MQHATSLTAERSGESSAFPIGPREFVAMMASLMALNALAIDAMLPAFPAIGESFAIVDANQRQFIVSSYLLGMGIGSLFYGPISDRFGRRAVLLAAMGLYAVFALLCALAPSFDILLALRFAQGMSAAALGVLAVSIIRDRFVGDGMARRMSMVFIVFMAVPVIAPTLGQLVLYVSSWRAIFVLLAVMASIVSTWVWLRLPETLPPEQRSEIRPRAIASAWRTVMFNRIGLFYILAAGTVMGALFGFLNSSQQVFSETFGVPDIFPYAFACVAGCMAIASYSNSRIVERFGARRVSHTALISFILLSIGQSAASQMSPEPLGLFLVLLALNMGMVGFLGANFGSIAMEPFGHVAGTASSFQSFIRTILAALIGAWIGQQFNGTSLPLTLGFLVCGLLSLLLVLIAEKGKLFRRPRTCPNSPY